jgi:hypothetical protein
VFNGFRVNGVEKISLSVLGVSNLTSKNDGLNWCNHVQAAITGDMSPPKNQI